MQGYCPCPSPNGFLYATTNRTSHQTREPRGLSPSGGNFTAKPHVSRAPCAPMARSPGCRGTTPARPASREACRRAAVTSRPSRMSPEQPRAQRAQCGVKGQCPLSPNGGLCYTICREPHQTGEPWHLSCHGGNLTAKPHVSRAPCAPMARSPGCRGTTPATTPAGDLWGSGF